MKLKAKTSILIVATVFSVSAIAAQPKVSTIQMVTPGNQTAQTVNVSSNSNGTVRQRQNYGQGYRYGKAVNGPNGKIIIWSTAPNYNYGSVPDSGVVTANPGAPVKNPGHNKSDYGKTTNPDYGD